MAITRSRSHVVDNFNKSKVHFVQFQGIIDYKELQVC